MQQVADWLSKLDLAQYAQCFADNDISFVILPDDRAAIVPSAGNIVEVLFLAPARLGRRSPRLTGISQNESQTLPLHHRAWIRHRNPV
jgi:hypothetical protein